MAAVLVAVVALVHCRKDAEVLLSKVYKKEEK